MKDIPSPAFWLGWAGVIPFAALSSRLWADGAGDLDETVVLRALVSYGAIILSFMGGVQWGLELTRGDGNNLGFLASVVPALAAFAATLVHPMAALAILAAGFILLLFYDLRRIRAGIGPAWYGRLRVQLSTAVVICLIAAAVVEMRV